ncbi:MAG: discoidin domain-containing protein, partial [Christensenellales bacterium]
VVGADIASVAEITTKNNKTELGNITDGAYATKWKSGGKEAVLEFDLKEVRDIVETSVMFNYDIVFIGSDFINVPVLYNYTYSIEISTDGTEWTTFAENTGYDKQKAVFVDKKYARARYVRLSAVTDNSELAITDFKIRVVQ